MSSQSTITARPLLKEAEVAQLLNVEVATIRRWRWAGKPPPFVRIGAAVRYDPDAIAAFIEAGRRTSTSDQSMEAEPR
jgi:predicted site-specific integrase-resolvase